MSRQRRNFSAKFKSDLVIEGALSPSQILKGLSLILSCRFPYFLTRHNLPPVSPRLDGVHFPLIPAYPKKLHFLVKHCLVKQKCLQISYINHSTISI